MIGTKRTLEILELLRIHDESIRSLLKTTDILRERIEALEKSQYDMKSKLSLSQFGNRIRG